MMPSYALEIMTITFLALFIVVAIIFCVDIAKKHFDERKRPCDFGHIKDLRIMNKSNSPLSNLKDNQSILSLEFTSGYTTHLNLSELDAFTIQEIGKFFKDSEIKNLAFEARKMMNKRH
jgi:hypothetical protein